MKSNLLFSKEYSKSDVHLSIVIPTYKRNQFLISAIKSVIAQNEVPFNYEIIVVNNNPTDKMEDVKQIFEKENVNIKLYSNEENYGQVGNINQGIQLSRGKYVAFLHDDDLLLPEYFSSISTIITSEEKDCVIVKEYSLEEKYRFDFKHLLLNIIFFIRYLYRKPIKQIKGMEFLYSFRDIYNPPTCGTFFLKNSLLDYGYFKDEHGAAWDFYNFRLFNENYDVYMLDKYLGVRRTFTGMSNSERVVKEFREDEKEILKQYNQNWFIKCFGKALANHSGLKYYLARLISGIYFYLFNLDAIKKIPHALFKKYGGDK